MSQEMNLNEEEQRALDQLDQLGTRDRGIPDLAELCKKYQNIRPSLVILARVIRKIPGIGGKAGDALDFLMNIADVACVVG